MKETANSSWANIANPIFQALIAFGGVVLVNLSAIALEWMGAWVLEERFSYLTAASFLLCFAMFNSVLSLLAPNTLQYWGKSIYCFLGLVLSSVTLARALSGLRLSEAGSYWWILIVVTFGYLVFLALVNTIRSIVTFAQKEEWNQPRFRRGNRK
ncbi:hypothetical protein [Haliscomenobacter hydrossis]|uniref:Uncharacterized protein n=1 Tax=Haliscomenobacter hydrossis (strain ATCC 27775 / DSM 1100 / LMG 10767 / O) TaxID=760192 RepID=F4KSR8_HALH1|nr:hypothetical protein [Haliscomenobacter hydrossis]AEE48032.1 hypothetical protein Halhy_0119 [Haliscomenobacter hydrossis DSM 1100]